VIKTSALRKQILRNFHLRNGSFLVEADTAPYWCEGP